MVICEYLPWSSKELKKTIDLYKQGNLSIVDIELGGACNYHCIYCDSPDRHKLFYVDLDKVQSEIEKGSIRWIYICGLGEPTFGDNRKALLRLLQICEKTGVRISMFSNLSMLDDELLSYVKKGLLFVLFKMDSFNNECANDLYGTDTSIQSERIQKLINCVNIENGCTNIAASIVPTVKNIDEISDIVGWCIDNKVYPLLAELEHAGRGTSIYDKLSPKKHDLLELKTHLFKRYGINIHVPICPSIIGGIHINNRGYVTVDKKTGFSCHWFWLETPSVKQIGDFNRSGTIADYQKDVINYRKSQAEEVNEAIESQINDPFIFGGCGGSLSDILNCHINLHR